MSRAPENTTRHIVVAVDGSDAGATAVVWAANAALKRDQPVKLVSAYASPAYVSSLGSYVAEPSRLVMNRIREDAEHLVEEARQQALQLAPGLEITTEVSDSDPVVMLIEESRTAEMIVMGSRGLGGFAGMLVGSVSAAVVSHASCPVVVLREDTAVAEGTKYGPVVVGVDGSEVSRVALQAAFEEAQVRGAKVRAVHSTEDTEFSANYASIVASAEVAARGRELMDAELTRMNEQFPDVDIDAVLERKRPAQALARHTGDAQLLVVGSHGRGGFAGMLLGSTSRAMLHHAKCPLMVARPKG